MRIERLPPLECATPESAATSDNAPSHPVHRETHQWHAQPQHSNQPDSLPHHATPINKRVDCRSPPKSLSVQVLNAVMPLVVADIVEPANTHASVCTSLARMLSRDDEPLASAAGADEPPGVPPPAPLRTAASTDAEAACGWLVELRGGAHGTAEVSHTVDLTHTWRKQGHTTGRGCACTRPRTNPHEHNRVWLGGRTAWRRGGAMLCSYSNLRPH